MIRSDRVLDPALKELKRTIKLLLNNKYKADFAEFTVAWVIYINVNWRNLQRIQNHADSTNLNSFTTGYTEPSEMSMECVNFA